MHSRSHVRSLFLKNEQGGLRPAPVFVAIAGLVALSVVPVRAVLAQTQTAPGPAKAQPGRQVSAAAPFQLASGTTTNGLGQDPNTSFCFQPNPAPTETPGGIPSTSNPQTIATDPVNPTCSTATGVPPNPFIVTKSPLPWPGAIAGAKWIGARADGGDSVAGTSPPQWYIYDRHFDVPCASGSLSGSAYADNAVAVFLNGQLLASQTDTGGGGADAKNFGGNSAPPLAFGAPLTHTSNVVDFVVRDASAASTGLDYSMTVTPGTTNCCTLGEFGNPPDATSQMQVACTLTTPAATAAALTPKTEDFPETLWHWGAARKTAADGSTTMGSKNIASASAHFTAADINHGISVISGPNCIPVRAFIIAVGGPNNATINLTSPCNSGGAVFLIENSPARSVIDGHCSQASTTLTSATANFNPSDVNKSIEGPCLRHGTVITAVSSPSTVTINQTPASSTSMGLLTIGEEQPSSTTREASDGHTTSASTTVTSASANFQPTDTNLPITGSTCIPAGDYIKTVTNATTVVLNAVATCTSASVVLTIGLPNRDAPLSGDVMTQLGSESDINPALGPNPDLNESQGADPCSANTPEGLNFQGQWFNPGSFQSVGVLGAYPQASLTSPAIAQIVIRTQFASWAGYVTQVTAGMAGESQPAAHYDVTWPFWPLGSLGMCPSPSTLGAAWSWQYNGITVTQQGLQAGLGTPGTQTVRDTKDFLLGQTTKTTTAFEHLGTLTMSTNCTETYPDTTDFGCGDG